MLKIKTELFKGLLDKAIKGCSFNKMIPITGLLSIEAKNGVLTLFTTDKINYLRVSEKIKEDVEDFVVVVDARLFTDLINKTTSEYISMELNKESLYVEGNGSYFFEIPVDENGEMIKFPDLNDIRENGEAIEIDMKKFRDKLLMSRAALPLTLEAREMNNYYLKDKIITSDVFKVTCLDNLPELKDSTLFFSREFGDLIIAMDYPKAKILVADNKIQLFNDNFVLLGEVGDMFDKYPIEGIQSYIASDFKHDVVINRKDIMEILERITLFVSVFDRSTIRANFTKDGIEITSKKKNGKEFLSYVEAKLPEDFKQMDSIIDVEYLKSQLDVQSVEKVTVHFGNDSAIKITSPEVIQIIALSEEEEG